jgi:hypothetical protein
VAKRAPKKPVRSKTTAKNLERRFDAGKDVSDYFDMSKAKRPGTARDHDFTTVARRVVEQAIGEQLDGSPLPDKNKGKNPAAVALGKLGGAKGGRKRAEVLSPSKRKAIARKAAAARWAK